MPDDQATPQVDWPPRRPSPTRKPATALTRPAAPPQPEHLGLSLRPLIRVTDMAASVGFYEQLGGEIIHGGHDSDYVLMQLGTAQVGLLADDPHPSGSGGHVDLDFSVTLPLDRLAARLAAAGIAGTDRGGPEELEIRSPDGLLIRISRRDPDPYV